MNLSDNIVYIVGGGPSLKGFDFTRLKGRGVVVGANRAVLDIPCDMGVSVDQRFILWLDRRTQLREFSERSPFYICPPSSQASICQSALPCAHILKASNEFVWDETVVHRTGGTSGYCALDVVACRGAKRVVLLGFDYQPSRPVTGQPAQYHYHDGYPWVNGAENGWHQWARNFGPMNRRLEERDIQVINASPDSKISCFPKMSIEDALMAFERSDIQQDTQQPVRDRHHITDEEARA
jgi:hypothetical protein